MSTNGWIGDLIGGDDFVALNMVVRATDLLA
ncbi:MAG: hypothetical protein CFH10_01234 [Alphaproteobacteria bacterium MarineAlpha4_Bin2]|nr:MAG: hypothetical protein CFH10_01234 [Alphaproteobacteria bacterium MarineAlpha4_Bin2]